ncbi:hypothetical protein K504DRAFT_499842 [Pleomassaria siparia CBS 279.74]|uniref:Uncharacterized protein n=1 Tax=Pleomassaria siparia CBS 279.74 TaxID=1314801 RepID=A0A6G1KJV6_9PLEO|nr:hypothetical protein K504DRAFT_499842 [Pleomassaria siparia CBS 279.74]
MVTPNSHGQRSILARIGNAGSLGITIAVWIEHMLTGGIMGKVFVPQRSLSAPEAGEAYWMLEAGEARRVHQIAVFEFEDVHRKA